MFPNVGWSELLLLAVVGLVVFGPNRLPTAVRDAVKMLRQVRAMARNAASDLRSELGPEMADLNLRSLNPKTMLADALDDRPAKSNGSPTPVGRVTPALPAHERPPYDPDAT